MRVALPPCQYDCCELGSAWAPGADAQETRQFPGAQREAENWCTKNRRASQVHDIMSERDAVAYLNYDHIMTIFL